MQVRIFNSVSSDTRAITPLPVSSPSSRYRLVALWFIEILRAKAFSGALTCPSSPAFTASVPLFSRNGSSSVVAVYCLTIETIALA